MGNLFSTPHDPTSGVARLQRPPPGWEKLLTNTSSLSDSLFPLSIALRQPSIRDASSALLSNTHLSREQAQALVQPEQEDVEHVLEWLESNNFTENRIANGFIQLWLSPSQAEKMFNMTLSQYQYQDHPPALKTEQYYIPSHLSQAIDFVHPIANFMTPKDEVMHAPRDPEAGLLEQAEKRRFCANSTDSPCERMTNPSCIRQMYGMPSVDNGSLPALGSSQSPPGIAGFLEEFANYEDVLFFLKSTAPQIAATGYNFTTELINGGQNSQDPRRSGNEAALDMEYAMSLAYPAKVTFYSTGGRGTELGDPSGTPLPRLQSRNEPYLDLIYALLARPDAALPKVLSISYADDELSVPKSYAQRVCDGFGVLSSRGVTILTGSGDGGAAGGRNSVCLTNDGTREQTTMATFPGTCPWVTAVGSTTGSTNPLRAAHFSGGGFSQYFPRPSWQASEVDKYVTALNGHLAGKYDSSMRAVPDISAIGTAFLVLTAHVPSSLQGTSASGPVLGSMLALINDERMRQGKKPLGWLNQRLYSQQVQAVLNDVTVGKTASCEWAGKRPGGWPCTKGWDAATGLGSVGDFEDLMAALMDD